MKTSHNLSALVLIAATLLLSACEPTMPIAPQPVQQAESNFNEETAPKIEYMLPSTGSVRTPVHIYGQHFSLTASDNQVWFDNTPATAIKVASGQELVVEVPSGARSGAIRIAVNGQDYTGSMFTVTAAD